MQDFFATNNWVWIDYAIAGILVISCVGGLWRGFVREIFGMLSWLAAVWIATLYCEEFSPFLQQKIALPTVRTAVSFAILFFACLMFGGLISYVLNRMLTKTGLHIIDRIVGLGFGILRGAILVSVLVMIAGLTPLPKDAWWKQSKLLPPFQSLAVWLKDRIIPPNLATFINYH